MSTTILTIEALQELSSAEAVVQLFQRLGYQTLSNFALPVNQLFPTPELQLHVKRVWAIAQYQPLLYVYQLEVDSLSNTLVKQLCRVIARRQGNYLLVFTKDYSELAFVNLVRSTSQESGRSIELRRLDIDRANPTQKAVRILRRIAVADTQMPPQLLAVKLYKKQCEAFELTKWRHDEFNNLSLFSDYYLKERLPDEPSLYPEWQQDIMSVYQKARRLYQSLDFDALQRNESATQEKWVSPILHLLGHSNIEQSKDDAHPTFRLFSDVDYDSERASPVLCHVKAWGHYLDHYGQQEQLELEQPLNPSFQIIRFLSEYRADWGILTNGREWRLYYTKAHATASNYYEIDLAELLESNDVESFRYFYHFFCQQAFRSEAERKSFLERVYDGSQDYAVKLAERIKDKVFEHIFPFLAEGFVTYRRQEKKITQETDDSLKLIFASSLTLLYRLLFLLYAEDRDLLPVGEQYGYRRYSLKALKEYVSQAVDDNQTYSRTTYRLWNELESLFNVIANGDRDLNVPAYNGGLFSGDNPRNAFLAEHKIADYWLATALDLLTREVDPDTRRKGFIDYKSLGVNQLGSIYEGLLEFYLRIADEELAVIRRKGKEIYKPIEELPKRAKILRTVSEGEIYLENDKQERKATGSYYTPDYIVKYIVENTVGPVLEEKFKKVEELFTTEVDANATEHPAVTELFSLKVLDPAMGSGHFLVEAVDFITEKIIAFLAKHPTNPVFGDLERIRATIREEMESQGVMIDDSQLTDANLLKRRVMKSCIYGVDLNDMAVELSKLSLWLDAFTLGAPLSFLDHHLKCGNSLIGIQKIESQIVAPGSDKYKNYLTAIEELVQVSRNTDATITDVSQSHELYEDARKKLEPMKAVANVVTARHFVEMEYHVYARAMALAGEPYDKRVGKHSKCDECQELAREKHFFHWPLEFPEVFYALPGKKETQGFDAVVGNPPYERTKYLTEDQPVYNELFQTAYGAYDIYILFIEKGLSLLSSKGQFSFIVSNKFLVADYGQKLRDLLVNQYHIHHLIDLTECPSVFQDALISPLVIVASPSPTKHTDVYIAVFKSDFPEQILQLPILFHQCKDTLETEIVAVEHRPFAQLHHPDTGHFNIYLVGNKKLLERKVHSISSSLGELYPLRTGIMGFEYWNFEPHIMDMQTHPSKYRKILTPSLIDRYQILWGMDKVNLYKKSFRYPVLDMDISPLNESSKDFFKSPKVVVRGTARRLSATLDTYGHPLLVAVHGICYENLTQGYFLTSFINSKLANWLHVVTFYSARIPQGSLRYPVSFYKNLPIRHLLFTTPKDERSRRGEELKSLYESNDYDGILIHIDELLPKDANGNFLAFVRSISIKDAITKGYMTKQDAERFALKEDGPSGYNESGNPLEQSDVVHDFLAFLAEQMIEMNKEKQAEVSKYLEWFESTVDAEINDLTGKTTLQSYYDSSWDDVLGVLIKNKSKLSINPTLPLMQNMLEDEYRKSMNVLEPLMKRIAATDDLIDRIVYRLYGLTEEEIQIVEEATK